MNIKLQRISEIYNNKIFRGASFGGLAKISSVVLNLMLTPLLIKVLNIELFGIWMLFSSIIAALSFSDFGLGNGLVNELVNDRGDVSSSSKEYISSTFFLLFFIGIIIFLIAIFVAYYFDLKNIFNAEEKIQTSDFQYGFLLFVLSLAITMPLSVVQKIQTAYQKIDSMNKWIIVSQLSTFVVTAVVATLHPNFLLLICVYLFTPILVLSASYFREYIHIGQTIRPFLKYFELKTASKLLKNGSLFLCLQILSIIGAYSDQIYIGIYLGPKDVAVFSIYQKLAATILIVQFVVLPLWPSFGDAILKKNYPWLLSMLKKTLLLVIIITVAIALIYYFYAFNMISIWIGSSGAIEYNYPLILGFSIWMLVASVGGVMSMIMNNKIFIKYQIIFYFVATIISVALKIYAIPLYGVHAAILATSIAYGVFFIMPSLIYVFGMLKRLNGTLDEV